MSKTKTCNFKTILFSTLSVILIISTIALIFFIKWIKTPDVFETTTTLCPNAWSNVSNDIKFISKKIEVINNKENTKNIYVRMIDSNGNVIVQPTLIKFGNQNIITNNWQIFNKRFVQAKSLDDTNYYTLTIKHAIN